MNKKDTIRPIDKASSLQRIIIDEIHQKISDATINAENTSKEKYTIKEKLIESASDMNTQEKMNAMDINYNRRNQERWQNVLCFTIISFSIFGIAIGSTVTVNNVRKFHTIA